MKHLLVLASSVLLTSAAAAQQGYSAKSLFFATDGAVISVPTSAAAPPVLTAGADASAQAPAPAKVKQKPATQVASAKPGSTTGLGASYFIRLKNGNGTSSDVLASRTFKSGERFQLGIKVNRPTYVYIFNEAPDGKITMIYPQPGHDNHVDAMGVVFFPSQGAFEFDGPPGTEQLSVYVSPRAMDRPLERIRASSPDLVSEPRRVNAVAVVGASATVVGCGSIAATAPVAAAAASSPRRDVPGRVDVASADLQYASKAIAYRPEQAAGCAGPEGMAPAYASKAIVFTDDATPAAGGQVATYVVKPAAKGDDALHLKLKLTHQ